MTTDVNLYLLEPGERHYPQPPPPVGLFAVRGIESRGQRVASTSMLCLDIDVEAHVPPTPLSVPDGKDARQLAISWLQLEVTVSTQSSPHSQVGVVHIEQKDMLPLRSGLTGSASWAWEIRAEDIERVERARSNQTNAPILFHINISGIVKLIDVETRQFFDILPIRGSGAQLQVELSQWERLMQTLGYAVPPSQTSLVGVATQEHPSWSDATRRLGNARSHFRAGEDYDALRECLSALEGLVKTPYSASSWKALLGEVPEQKADGLAEMFSGFATFCNKIGHHRDRTSRDSLGDFPVMPLDHWEADIAVAVGQFIITYATRLRSTGVLADTVTTPAELTETVP